MSIPGFTLAFVLLLSGPAAQPQKQEPSRQVKRYSPYAAAGGYSRQQPSFWEFWLSRFNPRNVNYGAWLEQKRRAFLRQAGANPYFWFAFSEFAAICLLVLCVAKSRIDRKDAQGEAASFMADLANYAEYCKQNALEAIRKHNDHIEICNRVIEAEETGRPITSSGTGQDWKAEMETLREKADTLESENSRLKGQLEAKEAGLAGLSSRVDELARSRDGKPNGAGTNSNPNLDLVARVNRLTAELDGLRDENRRLKRMHQDASRGG